MENLKQLPKEVDELIFYLDDIGGKKLYQDIKKKGMHLVQKDEEKRGTFLALQFLIMPFLSTRKIYNLLQNHLYIGLSLDDIDLTERVNKKLLMIHLNDRNNCKKELKSALVNNKEQITEEVTSKGGRKLKNVDDWIKDYIGQISKQHGQTLGEAQYFFKKSYFQQLDEDDKKMLKKLFTLYKFLNTSSRTPGGFEDDVLIKTEDGRLITTHKGKVVTLYNPEKDEGLDIAKPKARTVSGPPKTKEEKEIDKLKEEGREYAEGGLEREALEEEISNKKKVEDLRIMANNFQPGSLERRAIEEEIKKLEVRS